MDLSIVSPARNEADNLGNLLVRLAHVLEPLDLDWELVLVDDGSTDDTWRLCEQAAERDPRIRGLRLSRNFGHQVAITAGLGASAGDLVITMDSDLQHPPEVIPLLLDAGRNGNEVVYAVREHPTGESWFKRRSADLFYRALSRLTSLDLPHGGADFRLMSRRVVEALLAMPERNRFLRGMTRWVGFEQATVTYQQPVREGGRSKYTPRHMFRFAWDAIASFSAIPLRVASVLGFVVSGLGALYLAYVLGAFFFTDLSTPGWTSTVGALLVLSGVQLICLGLIGQYLGRMYEEVKGRPLYFVADDTRTRQRDDSLSPL
jgi:glycosyltransferase involved in cell wall biosynthesis